MTEPAAIPRPTRRAVHCRQCDMTWQPAGLSARENCPKCGKVKDVRERARSPTPADFASLAKLRSIKSPGRTAEQERRWRRRALMVVGGGSIACVRCGCDRPELLEINHKNGGGRPELLSVGKLWTRKIARLERDTSDLELLCRPCNAVHYLEMKHGPLPFSVTWEGER